MVDETERSARSTAGRRRRPVAGGAATPEWSRPDLPHVVIYTDGGAIGNPGPGGWAAILRTGETEKELTGGYRLTTNNRMEITAAIRGLEALSEPARVTIYTDSQYLANAISLGWARRWKSQGWMRNRTEPALNPDLWERLLALLDRHEVRFEWVRGHAGHPENERADRLAVASAKGRDLPPDEGYTGR